ncbi:hypothetical protein Tco_0137228 [Tanacetum coccineum]
MFKRRLITADQASVFMAMTFEQRSSSLVLHQMASAENNTSGPTSHHNDKWCLLKITLQAPPRSSMFKRCVIATDQASVFMAMTFDHSSSSLVLHQMTSAHNRSELGIHDHGNEPSSSKQVPKVVPLAVMKAT